MPIRYGRVVGFVVYLVLCFVLGRMSWPHRAATSEPLQDNTPGHEASRVPLVTALEGRRTEKIGGPKFKPSQNRSQNEVHSEPSSVALALIAELEGEPRPFVDEQEHDAAEDDIDAKVRACGFAAEVTEVDCDENPCIVTVEVPSDREGFHTCPGWDVGSAGMYMTACKGGTSQTLFQYYTAGEDPLNVGREDYNKRITFRATAARQRVGCERSADE